MKETPAESETVSILNVGDEEIFKMAFTALALDLYQALHDLAALLAARREHDRNEDLLRLAVECIHLKSRLVFHAKTVDPSLAVHRGRYGPHSSERTTLPVHMPVNIEQWRAEHIDIVHLLESERAARAGGMLRKLTDDLFRDLASDK